MQAAADALNHLTDVLRGERSVIAPHVSEAGAGGAEPILGELVAAGPRARHAPGEYALVVESIREGYLLHYGSPRLIEGADDDLSLLAGDFLYAVGLERLARLGDVPAVRELSDLISLAAQIHAEDRRSDAAEALWLGCIVAIGCGPSPGHDQAKVALRERTPEAAAMLLRAARDRAAEAGVGDALELAAQPIDFGSLRG